MSESARYHAREWANGKTAAAITQRIAELTAAPEWQGVEFDDARVRHMRQTEVDTLREILAGMPAQPAPRVTLDAAELRAAGVGARVLVWDNELDDTVTATVISYDSRGWPMFELAVDAGQYGPTSPAFRIPLRQGAYTDSGHFRVVGIVAARQTRPELPPLDGSTDDDSVPTTSCPFHGTLHAAVELCPLCIAEERDAYSPADE